MYEKNNSKFVNDMQIIVVQYATLHAVINESILFLQTVKTIR